MREFNRYKNFGKCLKFRIFLFPGLRPPLYSLPPAAQYPYSLMGADQLAAWWVAYA